MIPTPEQARQLVEHFGSQRKAAKAVGVHNSTIGTWLRPEASRAASRAAYQRNKDRILARQREYYERNKEQVKARNRRWHHRNKDAANQAARRWHDNNPGYSARRSRARYYRLKDEGLCVECGQPGLSEAYCIDCLTKRSVYG